MTVFFTDQFTHLVGNFNYLAGLFREQSFLKRFAVADFYNVSFTFIIAVDVGVAWCGYVLASRWIKTGYVSVEPTLLGWVAALLCYPPTWLVFQAYFVLPSEKAFFAIPNHGLVWLFAIISIASYMIYMSATLAFGLRFSNLTHRGIIRNGPYAYIRHPAYAAKNFSWWCVIFPFVLFQIFGQGKVEAAVYIIGLIATTYLYYMRVITEERHLSMDPEYQDYCKQVPYRFIPKLL